MVKASKVLSTEKTYINPVHNRSCPDPYVLKFCGEYWAYCTGFWHDGRCFGILHSTDLVHWTELSGAMEPFPEGYTCYWAPEVIYDNGKFYMYYSVGNEVNMQVRVAVAEDPAGPFMDSGHGLTKEEFAIDAHIFIDEDGSRYMFYATDFLTHSHIGTGTVCDRMIDLFTLAGNPQPVSRAKYDWQVYHPNRPEKGGVRWHTVEGPFVLKHKNLYYQMFSGGNWQNPTYGVSYAVSDKILLGEEWSQVCDGVDVLPIIRTLPDKVIGPGHNSVVRGPDNQQLYCIYHCWAKDGSARVLAIDRQDWAGDRMTVLGPSFTPQPVPNQPFIKGFSNAQDQESFRWKFTGGEWIHQKNELVQNSVDSKPHARLPLPASSSIIELSFRIIDKEIGNGELEIGLYNQNGKAISFSLLPNERLIKFLCPMDGRQQSIKLPKEFNTSAYHLLRIDIDGLLVKLALEGVAQKWEERLSSPIDSIELGTSSLAASFRGFELTVGWQDLFTDENLKVSDLGWYGEDIDLNWTIAGQKLCYVGSETSSSSIRKGPLLNSYELVINAELGAGSFEENGSYGFYPVITNSENGALLTVERSKIDKESWVLMKDGEQIYQFPDGFDPSIAQHFRFRKENGALSVQWESLILAEIEIPSEPSCIGLYTDRSKARFDMVRVIAIRE
jgi:GH43 family beta-xylosidase